MCTCAIKTTNQDLNKLIESFKKSGSLSNILKQLEAQEINFRKGQFLKEEGLDLVDKIKNIINNELLFDGKRFKDLISKDLLKNLNDVDIEIK